jgi:hypothetical protein
MKSIFRVLLVIILIGCESENSNIAPDTPEADNFSFINGVLKCTADERVISIHEHTNGIVSSISDLDGNTLFEMVFEYKDDVFTAIERTPTDELKTTVFRNRNIVYETYNFNGRSLTVSYQNIDYLNMKKQCNQYSQGNYSRVNPDLLVALVEFENFYSMDNTLHDNEDGKLLASTLASPELAEYARTITIGDGPPHPEKAGGLFMTVWCGAVGVGTTIKCFVGGPGNPFCIMGTIVNLACIAFQIASEIWTL